jgi:N-acetylneuraminic acid mutarotase
VRYVATIGSVLVLAGCASAAPAGWQRGADAPEGRTEVTAVAVGGRVVVAGGFTADGRASARADLYDPAADRWSRLPDLPIALHHAMSAGDGRRAYVVGGYATANALTGASRRVFSIRPGDAGWSELPQLPVSRAAGGAAVVQGRLYVVGGTFGQIPRLARRSFVLDLRTRRWTAFPGVPQPREHLGAAAAGDRIYVLGGRTAAERFKRADAWDISERRWLRVADMPTARGGTAATARAGRLVSIGGESSRGTNREVEELNPATGRWRRLPPLPEGRHGLGVAADGGRLLVLLGGPQPGLSVSAAVFILV